MNKNIRLLIEGFFDDDLFNDSNNLENTFDEIHQMNKNSILNDLETLLAKINIEDKQTYLYWDISDIKDKKIYVEIDEETQTCLPYYISIKKGIKKHIVSMRIHDINIFNNLIQLLSLLNIKNFYTLIVNRNSFSSRSDKREVMDFLNIQFDSYYLNNSNIKNINIDKNIFYKSNLSKNFSNENLNFIIENCTLENVTISNIDGIQLSYIKNLKDFSFIKHINLYLTIKYIQNDDLPKCNSLQGLPSGDYNLEIIYNKDENKGKIENIPIQSIKGIPNNIKAVSIDIYQRPYEFLQYFSFEGLTLEILPKFKFNAHHFLGKNHFLNVQLGPFKLQVNSRNWKPTKPQYQTIINTQDWFLDCYKTEPHKEYKAPKYTEEHSKELKKIEKYQQGIKDKEEDVKLMIDKVKTVLKENIHYYSKNFNKRSIKIEKMGDTKIQFIISYIDTRHPTLHRYIKPYIEFLKWIKDSDFEDSNGKLLHDLIIGSVQKRRERINKKRKEEEKELRKQEKLNKKQNKNKQEEKLKDETPITLDNKLNIEIIDYSPSSIAIFGRDTYYIKDLLKELGAKFNKYLTRDDKKVAGWIISKRKQNDIEKIINEYK